MKVKYLLAVLFMFATIGVFAQNTAYLEPFNRGKTEMMKGNLNEGLALLKQAQALAPDNLYVKYYIAKATSWQNRLGEAKTLYSEIVQASAQDSEIYWMGFFGYSQILSWQKEYEQAKNNFSTIINSRDKYKINPVIIRDARLSYGDVISWQKNYQEALDYFMKMAEENPDDVEVLNRISKIHFWMFNLQESKKYCMMVLEKDPANPEAKDRLKQIADFRKYEIAAGYSINPLTSDNTEGDRIIMHNYFTSFKYNHNTDLSFNGMIRGLTSNSVETTDTDKQSSLNTDFNFLAGVFYKFTPRIYSSFSLDYTVNAEIMPDFDADAAVSYKFSPNADIFLNYKFTYDKLDTYEKNKTLLNHIFAPGMTFYFSNLNYIKIQPTLSTDFNDYNYLVSVTQNFAFSSYNLFAASVNYGAGKRIMEYADSTTKQNLKSYGISFSATHYFNTVFGLEASASYSSYVDEYDSVMLGIKGMYRF